MHPLLSNSAAFVFDEGNSNWTRNSDHNVLFLRSVQNHMNDMLQIRGHVFLNDVFDALRMPRVPAGQLLGWFKDDQGSGHIDFGAVEKDGLFLLEFNVDDREIWTLI